MKTPAPNPVWRWPPAIMSMKDLFDALRAGFDLRMTHADDGQTIYQLSKDGIPAPIGILSQAIASRSHRYGHLIGAEQPDGSLRFSIAPRRPRARK